MAKQLNPMPSSAQAARRTLWVQAVLALLLAGGLLYSHHNHRNWVPQPAVDDVYRWTVGLAAAAVVVFVLTVLMRYQWRWLWIVLLIIELGSIAGLIWTAFHGINWVVVVVLCLISLVALWKLLSRVSRRWFHH